MNAVWLERYVPKIFVILLFEDGRKQGLGLWLIVMSFFLFVCAENGFGLSNMEAGVALGAAIFTGGNIYDKRDERLRMKIENGTDEPHDPLIKPS